MKLQKHFSIGYGEKSTQSGVKVYNENQEKVHTELPQVPEFQLPVILS